MNVMHPHCAALDLGKDVMVAAVRVQDGACVERECRTYGTTSRQLLELSSWLSSHRVTHVVMEATGSYWKSVWHVLEGQFELLLAHPASIRNLPGRKSDVNDATWMADLLAHGLIRGSFVPPAEISALRELTRTRKQFVREVARHTQRIQKILDVGNLKITGLITDVLGTSGRAIVKALIAGEADPERLADLAHPRLRVKRERLVEALHGRLTVQQRRLLSMHLNLIETIEASIAQLDEEIERAVTPFRGIIERLKAVPGLSKVSVPAILGEIGVDMSRFKTHRHLVSWARLCPRLDESAGKVHSTRTLKGAAWTKTLLTQAAWAAAKTKDSYLHAQFLRLRARRGAKKAIVAVAASILTAVYYVIRDGTPYRDLGGQYFQQRDRSKVA
jgi:transposase